MSSYKYITKNNRASYDKSYTGETLLSLYLGGTDLGGTVPCGFVNARISPKELKGICEYLLKEINEMETNVKE
jgi:hypothetical protein